MKKRRVSAGVPWRFNVIAASGKMRQMDPWLIAFVLAVVFVAATAQTVTGFGFALVAVPFLIIVLEPQEVVVLTALVALANAALVTQRAWRAVPWRSVGVIVAGSVVGMPAGLLVLLFAPADALRIAVAAGAILMAVALAAGLNVGEHGRRGEIAAGAASGILATSTGMNGPPVVLYLAARRLHPEAFRGALSSYFFTANIFSLALFTVTGVLSSTPVLLAMAALPALVPATLLGNAMLGRLQPDVFRRVVLVMLVVTALAGIIVTVAR